MRHAPPGKTNGRRDPSGRTQQKPLSRPHSLSPSTQDGGEKRRERERATEKKRIHTHTHSRTRACRSNRSGGTKKKPAGRDRAGGVRIKRKLTGSIVSHFRSNKGLRHFSTPSLRPWISSRSLAGSHGVSGINKSNNTSQPGC